MTIYYLISKEEAELIEDLLQNKHCKKCPYEGGGIKSGIKSFLRATPIDIMEEE